MNNLGKLLPINDLPDDIVILDSEGEEINLKDFAGQFPAVQAIASLSTQKMLTKLVESGVLMTANQHEAKMAELSESVQDAIFNAAVFREINDADKIVNTKEFTDWYEKKATKADQALFLSRNPVDFVMGIKKYQGIDEKKAADAKAKADKDKKDHDDLHEDKGGHRPGAESSREASGSDFSDGFGEALAEGVK